MASTHSTSNDLTTHVPVVLNDELIGEVARCFSLIGPDQDQDQDLMNICLALGPIGAFEIRRSYLCGNDKYLVEMLHALMRTGSPHCVKTDVIFGPKGDVYCGDLMAMSKYDKVRDQITQWMEVNSHGEDDWRNRVTAENLNRQSWQFPLEANHIFNNLALASSIGLVDVVQYLVEDIGVDVQESANGRPWESISYDTSKYPMSPIELAVARFDTRVVNCLLSSDTLDFEGVGYHRAMRMVLLSPAISEDQLLDFVSHPKVNVNAIFTNRANYTTHNDELYDDRSMLMIAVRRAFDLVKLRPPADQTRLRLLIHKIDVLLKVGADPTLVLPDGHGMPFGSANNSALNFATNAMEDAGEWEDQNERDNILQRWGVVVEKLQRMQV